MTIRRIAMQAAVGNLTAGRYPTVDANGLLIDGTAILDSNGRILTSVLPTKIVYSYWHAAVIEKTVVTGTWVSTANASATDCDDAIESSGAGYLENSSNANNDEVHFGNLILNAGTYKVILSALRNDDECIIEILHGTTSIGTVDMYGTLQFNTVTTFTYSPTTRKTGNLRVKVSGKNASSSAYRLRLQRLEIIKTG